ncbi:DUF397 domain-containing protein [Actinophytocola gossypii]|uniref:DUF397 domain-containing protein n=1 Tax=Actinophytocola gossypii TaxID=2812003 RepID=A0ABT2J6L3_9PSEU|nr:DUF397 domain-containing protein [Actinophytocola gossypii]MCT2583331.1 DUF397 domain-containing protein [Actinophytocola gossypii]
MEATDRVVSWRKSSRSGGNGGACVEVGLSWRKSSRSAGNGSNCVEVAQAVDAVLVRDTKNRTGGTLSFTPNSWQRFLKSS